MIDDLTRGGTDNESARVALTVPLQRTTTASARRTRGAIVAWFIGLSGVIGLGVAAHLAPDAGPTTSAAAAVSTPDAQAVAAPTPLPAGVTGSRGPTPTPHHSLGEDGLVGGIVFGDNVPRLTQADIERDGYRYYGQLLARDAGAGR